jgi:hypothetical protein
MILLGFCLFLKCYAGWKIDPHNMKSDTFGDSILFISDDFFAVSDGFFQNYI